ncbi:MAG TPA: polysaccharide deacetylase family protein, partial [Planctomycetaceae bacterium]
MPIALIYHDVVPAGQFDASGFPGASAAHYKFSKGEFRSHLEALQRIAQTRADSSYSSSLDAAGRRKPALPCLLTFDDGGHSSLLTIAGMLEERGWTGHFFVTTDWIDSPAFLTRQQVCQLRERGHIVGSHSCSHPLRMSACTWEQLGDEWRRSAEVLSSIIGEQVTVASVPGGFYSRRVAQAAAQAGIRTLFTSEPTVRQTTVDGCAVVGRYSIDRSVSARQMAAIAAGRVIPRLRQALVWQAKKVAKTMAGSLYAAVRKRVLSNSDPL